ncbi:MAG: hypothetical protein QOJ19_1003 [Acidimicrobiia bacterium]|jgi:hypothetical protein|nr:hypothetical protein [Acidimicrobiia bacterium]
MAYAFIQDVPANEEMYRKVRALLPPEAPGLVAHIVTKREGGLRYFDVWESAEQWEAFRDAYVEPAVGEVLASYGIPHDHSMVMTETVDVVDVWCGRAH